MNNWDRLQQYWCELESVGLSLDISRMHFDKSLFSTMHAPMQAALDAMQALEGGAVANASEARQVGHYWLRAPALAPKPEWTQAILQTTDAVKRFAADLHAGRICPPNAEGFYVVLLIGVGGSALGAQFVGEALGGQDDQVLLRFLDNTDPHGIDQVLTEIDESLAETLTVVVSKSGSTMETRNALLEVQAAYAAHELKLAEHAVAVTCDGSTLHRQAVEHQWLATFPMWDWVGGRTSVLSAAGLVPLALQGIDTESLLEGARLCDSLTRSRDVLRNPAALLSLMWYAAGQGRGDRAMVVLPYCDRLGLLGRYLQQLVMESLGKGLSRSGQQITQGLTVYGNKGSTDQHAFVQQLREGRDDFFVTFVEVMRDRSGSSIAVDDMVTSGDCLHGLLLGTRDALTENNRQSLLIRMAELSPKSVGALIALFERAVGLYAELIDVNAYDQPGVEAGKRAANQTLALQRRLVTHMQKNRGQALSAEQLAQRIEATDQTEAVFHVLEHLAANTQAIERSGGPRLSDRRYQYR